MKIPIYIDFDSYTTYLDSNELDLNKKDPVDIYTSELLVSPPYINPQFVLAPRYFLKIKSPADQSLPTISIPIHKSEFSFLKNKVRILLNPSLSYGINSSYKVEYWEWLANIGYEAPVSKTKIKEEYWNIPSLDDLFIPRFSYNISYYNNNSDIYLNNYARSRLVSELVTVERTVDLFNNKVSDILDGNKPYIFAFNQDDIVSFKELIESELCNFNSETKVWTFSKKLLTSTLVRDLNKVDGELINGFVQTHINYILPFDPIPLLVTQDIV